MKRYAIVTLADKNYFELLLELIASINSFNERKNISICILDAGLKEDQIKILIKLVDDIKKAKWDIQVPSHKVNGKEWLKSQVSRAFLPDYFPNFEKYLWIDCDAWVQSWNTIDLYFKACANGKIGITQTIGAGYKILARVNWLFGKLALIKTQNYKHAKKSGFSEDIARKIAFAPHLNIGVFSLEKSSPSWKIWQDTLRQTLKSGNIFGSEGLAINIAVYSKKIEAEFLPLYCNWIASNLLPKYDEEQKIFTEPYLPNQKIGVMHLAGGVWENQKDMRLFKDVTVNIETLQGSLLKKSLRFGNI